MSVLLIDSSEELLEALEEYFGSHDFNVSSTALMTLLNRKDPAAWIRDINPDAVVFELSVPYEATWAFCDTLRSDARIRAPFVVTTMNKSAAERLTPARGAIEIISVPGDLPRVQEAVLAAAGATPGRTASDADRRAAQRRIGDRRHGERRHPADVAADQLTRVSEPGLPTEPALENRKRS